MVRGANVENAAYPVGTCAERTALGTAVVEGARRGDIRALAVATDISPPASPCGMCRQYIREFCEVGLRSGDGRESHRSIQADMIVMLALDAHFDV